MKSNPYSNDDLQENSGCRTVVFGVVVVLAVFGLGCLVLVVGCVGMVVL